MVNPELYLHALRQRLERREGRTLTVTFASLARRLGSDLPAASVPAVRRSLAQVGIQMRSPASGAAKVQLTLSSAGVDHAGRVRRDPLERAVAATAVIISDFGNGSGFVLDSRGLLVTGQHVLEGEGGRLLKRVRALFADGREVTLVPFRAHSVLDYALAWLDEGEWPTVSLGDPRTARYGQTVFAVGSPGSEVPCMSGEEAVFRHTVSRGVVSHPCQPLDGIDWIQTDAAIDHGNSGGPLVDERGAVLGISLRHHGDVHASGLALPVDYATGAIVEATRLGRTACLDGIMCRWCGDWRPTPERSYCRNCGVRYR